MYNWWKNLEDKTRKTIFVGSIIGLFFLCFLWIIEINAFTSILFICGFVCYFIILFLQAKLEKEQKCEKEEQEKERARIEYEQKQKKVKELEDKQRQRWEQYNQENPVKRTITTIVRGSRHYIDADDFQELAVGEILRIYHKPILHHPECTNVYADYRQIGTIKKDLAEDLLAKLGEGFELDGKIIELTESEDSYYPFTILIELYIRTS